MIEDAPPRLAVVAVDETDVAEIIQGSWSVDLALFKQSFDQTNVMSVVECVSRFTVLPKNPNKRTKTGHVQDHESHRRPTPHRTQVDHSIAAQSSSVGRIARPSPVPKPGFATPLRHGRKAP
ncbi:hypothetical protein V6766_06295 [Martelella sp. AMO21009]